MFVSIDCLYIEVHIPHFFLGKFLLVWVKFVTSILCDVIGEVFYMTVTLFEPIAGEFFGDAL